MNQRLDYAFVFARLKVKRANRHIQEAQEWFRHYSESDFYQIVDDRETEPGKQIFRVVMEGVPPNLPLAIGDAFHCLSAAMDYVATGLMEAKGGDTLRIYFPTDDSRKALRKSFAYQNRKEISTP